MSKKSKYARICAVCGKEYEYCNTCRSFSNLPPWMNRYCSAGCKDALRIAIDYTQKVITKDEAKKLLKSTDLSNLRKFKEDIQETINAIMHEDNISVTPKRQVENKKNSKKNVENTVKKDTAKTSEVSEN